MPKQYPTLDQEIELRQSGFALIAGLDEAGRGAWAGPVSAGAVILPLGDPLLSEKLEGVCDSKLCTPRQRDALYELICQVALAWAVALAPASCIDEIGISAATRQAMGEAISRLTLAPQALLIDYLRLPAIQLPQRAIKKGDLTCLSIAAASIMAKVTRDREMIALEQSYSGYGFARHKGYGTLAHRGALQKLGPSEIHRQSFAPVIQAQSNYQQEKRQ